MLTRKEMEARRLIGAVKLQDGMSQSRVAKRLGVSRTSVSRWSMVLRSGGGIDGLKRRKATGRPERLSEEQKKEFIAICSASPKAFNIESAEWTTRTLAEVIERRFGIKYNKDHIGRLVWKLTGKSIFHKGRPRRSKNAASSLPPPISFRVGTIFPRGL